MGLLKEFNRSKVHRNAVRLIFKCWPRFTVASAAIPAPLSLILTPSTSALTPPLREVTQVMAFFSPTKLEPLSTTPSTSCQVTVLLSRVHYFAVSTACQRLLPHGGHHRHHSRCNSTQSSPNLDSSSPGPHHLDHQGAYLFCDLVYEDYSRYKTDKEVNESK